MPAQEGQGAATRSPLPDTMDRPPHCCGSATLSPASLFSARSQQARGQCGLEPRVLDLQPTNLECPLVVFLLGPGAGQPAHGRGKGQLAPQGREKQGLSSLLFKGWE